MLLVSSRIFIRVSVKPQNEGAREMATLKAISTRLKSVKNIQKITQSMKMVSAAKLTKAEKDLKRMRPLGKGIQHFYTNAEIDKEEPSKEGPVRLLYIAVTSDRGLCGAVHSSVAKYIRNKLPNPGDNVGIVCIGDKARSLLSRTYRKNFVFVCQDVGKLPPTFTEACLITNEIFQCEFKYDVGKIIYNRFKTVVSNVTEELNFYNLERVVKAEKIQNYEDEEDDETLTSFVEFSIAVMIFYALKEGACSEQSSRMTAMDNASKNAGDMISKLTLSYNRTRQAVITRELIEIISGASAL